jgi:hypothetical protein
LEAFDQVTLGDSIPGEGYIISPTLRDEGAEGVQGADVEAALEL